MGARMRAHDWSSNPLGRPQYWPQSLRTILRVMLDSRFAMWMAWGPSNTFFCNDAYLPTTGIKQDRVLGAPAEEVWAEIWHDIGPLIDQVLATGEASWEEGLPLFLNRSGYSEETFHTFSYSPLYDDANQIAGMLCVVTETTDQVIGQRRLELLRKLAAQSISEVPSVSAAGAELLGALGLGRHDVPFAALYLTDSGHDSAYLAATSSAEVASRAPTAMDLDAPQSPWRIAEAILTGQPQHIAQFRKDCAQIAGPWEEDVQEAVVLPLTGSGQQRPVGALLLGVSTRRALDESYRAFLSLVAAQVASGLADAQARLSERQRAEALAELDRAKNTFFSNVSHEFRTPLTLMLGPVEELLHRSYLLTEDREALEQLKRNGLRMRKLVNSLLDFSRIEAGKVEANFQATNLAEFTEDLASTFRSAIESAGLQLDVQCASITEPVYVDRDMWEKVVLNLLSNAFKFTFNGTISVRLERAESSVELTVSDTGIGIAAHEMTRLFDRFHQVPGARSRSQEGSGIGLALVRELVRLHGGSIEAQSELGQGTSFKVTVPLGTIHLPAGSIDRHVKIATNSVDRTSFVDDALRSNGSLDGAPSVLPNELGGVHSTATGARILVVDDNADMRRYLERVLSPYWRIDTAMDGIDALKHMHQSVPDLIVTDIMMPHMDGFQLVMQLRSDERFQALPVIVLSAQAGEEARLSGLQRGADDYLVKPFSSRELVARIEVQLMRVRMRTVRETLNRRLADVFREAPVGVALLSGPEHVHEFVNEVYNARIHNRNVLGLSFREAFPELVAQGIADLLDDVWRSAKTYVGRSMKVYLDDPQTTQRHWSYWDVVYQPLYNDNGDIDGIAIVGSDVTQLVTARHQAEDSNRAKDEFIAMLGHELRNPLSPIVTALELMRMNGSDAFARERSILERQVQHMVRLVGDLMDVSRIARGNIDLDKEVVEVESVISRAIETAKPLISARRQTLDLSVSREGLPVFVDPARASQILANLLTNASKFSPEEAVIEVSAHGTERDVIVAVRDHGIGLPEAELSSVFDMFFQGHADPGLHRPRGGLGLGLSIAKNLATAHNGSLVASSKGLGMGSTFTLTLPSHQSSDTPVSRDRKLGSEAIDGHGQRVLVVDDNVDAARTLDQLLQTWGFDTILAFDGVTALGVLDQEDVDVVLLDIGLPEMDGLSVARRVRADPRRSDIKLIALTGYGQDTDIQRSIRSGFDAHLIKPVESARLASALGANYSQTETG